MNDSETKAIATVLNSMGERASRLAKENEELRASNRVLTAVRDENSARIITQRDRILELEATYVPQSIAAECLERLHAAGYDKPGQANTLVSMVKAACIEVALLRDEREAAYAASGNKEADEVYTARLLAGLRAAGLVR